MLVGSMQLPNSEHHGLVRYGGTSIIVCATGKFGISVEADEGVS
jgi:hypothetical protein